MKKHTLIILLLLISLVMISCNNSEPTKSETSLEDFTDPDNFPNIEISSEKEENTIISDTEPTASDTIETEEDFTTQEPTEPNIPKINKVNFIAVGDNLIHSMVIKSGLKKDGTYDYNYMYKNIIDEINKADIKAINQETMFITDPSKYSGYPTFGTPYEVGEATINAGFNVFTLATNHSYDKKQQGIEDTLKFYNSQELLNKDITYLGLNASQEEQDTIKIKEYNEISFAMINYTYGLNGFKKPSDKQYLVNTFMNTEETTKMLESITKANNLADFVIVFIHMGTEYTMTETSYQTQMATKIAEAGADLIIGTHPHVVEPLKVITTSDNREVPVYYSLGNFISNQARVNTMLGAMAKVTFVKEDDTCYIESFDMVPIVTHISNGQKNFEVYMLQEYTQELASKHKLVSKGLTLDELKKLWEDVYSKSTIKYKEEHITPEETVE